MRRVRARVEYEGPRVKVKRSPEVEVMYCTAVTKLIASFLRPKELANFTGASKHTHRSVELFLVDKDKEPPKPKPKPKICPGAPKLAKLDRTPPAPMSSARRLFR